MCNLKVFWESKNCRLCNVAIPGIGPNPEECDVAILMNGTLGEWFQWLSRH